MLFRSISTNKQFCISSFDSIDATHSTALVWRAETTKTNSFKAKSDHSTHLHTLVLFSHWFWWFRYEFDFSVENESKTIGTTRRATWCDVFHSRRSHHRPNTAIWSDWHWNFEFSRMSKFLKKISHKLEFKKKYVQNELQMQINEINLFPGNRILLVQKWGLNSLYWLHMETKSIWPRNPQFFSFRTPRKDPFFFEARESRETKQSDETTRIESYSCLFI